MESGYEVREGILHTPTGLEVHFTDYRPSDDRGKVPLLCLPGYWRNARDYAELARRLATQRRVVAPDMRGRGRSDRATDPADYHFDRLVEDCWRLLDQLGVERVVVLGVTLGVLMAMEMACQAPGRIAGAIFNDAGPEGGAATSQRLAGFSTGDMLSLEEAVERVRMQNVALYPGFGESDWIRMMKLAYREAAPGVWTRDMDERTGIETKRFKADRPTFWKEFERLAQKPVTLLRGELSDYVPAEVAARMAAVSKHVRIVPVPDRGHPPQLDEPASLAAIDDLLARVDAAGS